MINEKDQTIMVLHQVSKKSLIFKRHSLGSWTGNLAEKAGHWQRKHYEGVVKFEINLRRIPLRSLTFGVLGPVIQSLRRKQHKTEEACNLILMFRSRLCILNFKIRKRKPKTLWKTMNFSWIKCKPNADRFCKSTRRGFPKTT